MPRVAALIILLLAWCTPLLRGQSTSASLTGRVIDSSKARIAGAKITLIGTDTNVQYETNTDTLGEYCVPSLLPGRYRVEVEKADFKKLIKPDIILHVQDALDIDFEMQVGAISETIRVESGSPMFDAEPAAVSTVVDRTFVDNLPLNGRSFQTLITLTPGVVMTPTAFDDQGQFSVNGQRADANYFTVDGVSANFGVTGYFPLVQTAGGALPALSVSSGTNSLVSVDAMQEFRVQTSSFAPEFGRMPGGQISVVTRSGTDQFHGTAFEYFRNDVLDARDWFVNYNHLPKPAERQNDFGGVFGGPILKDRTFIFFSYEGLRLRQPATQQTVVPDLASRQQTPASVQPYLNAYPIPNGPAVGAGLAQFNGSYSNPSSLDAYSVRLDHVINSKLNLFGRYNYSPSTLNQRGAAFTTSALSTTESLSSSIQTLTAGITQLIERRVSNEVRMNYSNHRLGTRFILDDFGGAMAVPDSLLYPPGFSSRDSGFLFLISGVGEYGQGNLAIDEQRQVNLIDNLFWSKGSHELKFGVDYRWLSPFSAPFAYRQFVQFSGVACPPTPPCTGYALSGAPPGTTSTTAADAQPAAFQANALIAQNVSFYGQDRWKLTPRLTVTYGLRWDINPPLRGKNLANQPFTVMNLNDPANLSLAPHGTPLYETTYANVAPRVGVAYQIRDRPNWGTVLRGGIGTFYDLGYGSLGGASSYFPFQAAKNIAPAPFPLSSQDAAPPPFTTNPPVSGIIVADPHLKLPRTYEWNVAIEQSLGSSQGVSLTYVAADGRDLLRTTNLLNPNPDFQYVSVTNNTASSYYGALQLQFLRRFSRGLQALGSYTYSHSIDNASTDAFATYLNTPDFIENANIDRGNSDFDVRHGFSAGLTYSVPYPGLSNITRAALAGWSIDSFVYARSATPVDVIGGYSFAGGTEIRYRPDIVQGEPLELFGSQYPGGKIFNSSAFTPGPVGQQGDFGRNILRGFGPFQADFAVQRQFQITEAVTVRFRGDFFNIFNHPNFGNPNPNLTNPLFGHSTQSLANALGSGGAYGGLNPLYQIGGPRSIQLALKLQF